MSDIPKEVYLHAEWNKHNKSWKYTVSEDDDRTFLGEFLIGKAEVEFELSLDDTAMTLEQVKLLREEQSKTRAESERKCMALEEQIGQLLALPAPGVDDAIPF